MEVVKEALSQAKIARLAILKKMEKAIEKPREELNKYAPKMTRISIPIDKIGLVIGPGGKTIKNIIGEPEVMMSSFIFIFSPSILEKNSVTTFVNNNAKIKLINGQLRDGKNMVFSLIAKGTYIKRAINKNKFLGDLNIGTGVQLKTSSMQSAKPIIKLITSFFSTNMLTLVEGIIKMDFYDKF